MRPSSSAISRCLGSQTTAICFAPSSCHWRMAWPSTVVLPQGRSIFGHPILEDAPAARIITPNSNALGVIVKKKEPANRLLLVAENWTRSLFKTHVRVIVLAKRTNPDIPETDRIAVLIQLEIAVRRVRLERNDRSMSCSTQQFTSIMQDHAVMPNRHIPWLGLFSRVVPARCLENDVVSLPLAGAFARIYKRRSLAVNSASLAVWISRIIVGIEHLDLITPENIYAIIPSALPGSFNL